MWLYPGLRVKRWFLVWLLGMALAGAGVAVLLNTLPLAPFWLLVWRALYLWGLQFSTWGGGLLVVAGAALAWQGFTRMMASIVRAVLPQQEERLVELLYHKRYLARGPRIVAIGGGTGLSALLRGLKEYTSNITAIVTVADDGGSSGRLRGELGVLPPGDVRNCLVALADTESLMEQLVGYRFWRGDDLAGHSLGNL
ncbi:MAG: YvcK family protein, partial [Armatimonadota bacterium]|nr:YvcK family protein [Armatimonadota bacterium]